MKKDLVIQTGDIFELGRHRLLCGDARNQKLIQQFLGDNAINLIVTDPPYGVDYVGSKKTFGKLANSHKDIISDHTQSETEYQQFSVDWLQAIVPYLYSKNACYIFNSDKMIFALKDAMEQTNFKFTQLLIWVKNHPVVGRLDYCPQHELVAYGWYGKHIFRKSKGKSVLFFPKPNKSRLHPTMKPVSLIRHLILNSSQLKETVYDPFGGSGTTLIAAEQTKRKCFIVELDPDYCKVIINRWECFTGLEVTQYKHE